MLAAVRTLATGYILSKAKEKIEELEGIKFDMLMFGKQAIDGDTAQVGPRSLRIWTFPRLLTLGKFGPPRMARACA